MAGHIILEALSFSLNVYAGSDSDARGAERHFIGSMLQESEEGAGQIWVVCVKTKFSIQFESL